MTPDAWQKRFIEVSNELAHLASVGIRTGDDVTEREGARLEVLDALEMQAAAMNRAAATI